MSMNQIHLQM